MNQGTNAKGKLLLIPVTDDQAIIDCSLWMDKSGKPFTNTYDSYLTLLQEGYTPIQPVVVSETELPGMGDWGYYSRYQPRIDKHQLWLFNNTIPANYRLWFKVLVLPKDFTKKHIQLITDGVFTDGCKVIVGYKDSWPMGSDGRPISHVRKLIDDTPMEVVVDDIKPVQQKIYTEAEVKEMVKMAWYNPDAYFISESAEEAAFNEFWEDIIKRIPEEKEPGESNY